MNNINRILNKCVRSGVSMAEVYSISQKTMKISVRNGKVEMITKSTPGGLAIRYFSVDRVAFAHTTNLSDNTIDLMIAKLSTLSKKTSKLEFASLPEPQNITENLDIYGPGFTEISTDDKIVYLVDMENFALKYDPLIKQSNGFSYTETISTVKLVNTNGIDLESNDTVYDIGINLAAAKDNEMFPGEGNFAARHFEDLPNPELMVEKIAGRAVRLLGGTTIEPGEYEIILTPNAANSILYGLANALNGDDYSKGSTFLADKEEDKFADSKLSLIDDSLMPRGLKSKTFDDEGTASQKNVLIENGVLKTALYDFNTAARQGKRSTGSAARRTYRDFPNIWPGNFYIPAGKDKVDDVIASCRKGIVVETTQGWGLRSIDGKYSAGINGTLIRNGKRIKPVANVTLAASTDELFNGIGAICDDLTFYHSFNSPSIMIKKMHVGA